VSGGLALGRACLAWGHRQDASAAKLTAADGGTQSRQPIFRHDPNDAGANAVERDINV